MAFKVITLESAYIELFDAIDWFENEKPFLGFKFYNEFLDCIQNLSKSPQHYGFVFKDYRQVLLKKFPYKLIFKVLGTDVVIQAIFYTSRNSKKIIKKLK